jgi:hypothetical protein
MLFLLRLYAWVSKIMRCAMFYFKDSDYTIIIAGILMGIVCGFLCGVAANGKREKDILKNLDLDEDSRLELYRDNCLIYIGVAMGGVLGGCITAIIFVP